MLQLGTGCSVLLGLSSLASTVYAAHYSPGIADFTMENAVYAMVFAFVGVVVAAEGLTATSAAKQTWPTALHAFSLLLGLLTALTSAIVLIPTTPVIGLGGLGGVILSFSVSFGGMFCDDEEKQLRRRIAWSWLEPLAFGYQLSLATFVSVPIGILNTVLVLIVAAVALLVKVVTFGRVIINIDNFVSSVGSAEVGQREPLLGDCKVLYFADYDSEDKENFDTHRPSPVHTERTTTPQQRIFEVHNVLRVFDPTPYFLPFLRSHPSSPFLPSRNRPPPRA